MDFTKYKRIPGKAYNGANGKKIAIDIDGTAYMLKFPPNPTKKTSLSYTNSCISEYICCHIFNMLGISAQETMLGTYNVNGKEKIVCACRDFTSDDTVFYDFCSIKNTIIDSEYNGKGTDIDEILETIQLQEYIDPQVLTDFFYDVFVVDALVGNFDRHNGNWGFLFNKISGAYSIAPIYDCGSCLLPQADPEMIQRILNDENELNARVYNYPLSAIQCGGRKINYFQYISSLNDQNCNEAIERIVPRINVKDISALVDATPYISDVQKTFIGTFLTARYERILDYSFELIQKNDMIQENEEQTPTLTM
ncbi:MAG: HipA domain-containing protein [Ruminiclostridium sp.]|nr:HipA domain-containing protein [Ruminiclostridium sp.]